MADKETTNDETNVPTVSKEKGKEDDARSEVSKPTIKPKGNL